MTLLTRRLDPSVFKQEYAAERDILQEYPSQHKDYVLRLTGKARSSFKDEP
jgi:hypothetical protein